MNLELEWVEKLNPFSKQISWVSHFKTISFQIYIKNKESWEVKFTDSYTGKWIKTIKVLDQSSAFSLCHKISYQMNLGHDFNEIIKRYL